MARIAVVSLKATEECLLSLLSEEVWIHIQVTKQYRARTLSNRGLRVTRQPPSRGP